MAIARTLANGILKINMFMFVNVHLSPLGLESGVGIIILKNR